MTRRDLGSLVLRVAGTAAGQGFFASWMPAAEAAHSNHSFAPPEPDRWKNYKPQFFSEADFAALETFTSILIPTDDTPGAREANVAPFLDFIVFSAAEYAPDMQQEWRKAMDWLRSQKFGEMTPAQQSQLLMEASAPEHDTTKSHPGFRPYRTIKQMTIYAFYTSRVGLIDNLNYKGLAYLAEFPGCQHPEHHRV